MDGRKLATLFILALLVGEIGLNVRPAWAQTRSGDYSTANYSGGMTYAIPAFIQQSTRGTATSGTSIVCTLTNTPAVGNLLIMVVGVHGAASLITVSSIASSNTVWTKLSSSGYAGTYYLDAELWKGVISASAGKTVTATISGTITAGAATVYEFSNLEALDTATSTTAGLEGNPTTTIGPIGVSTTSNYPIRTTSALVIGATMISGATAQSFNSPTNGFTLIDGAGIGTNWATGGVYKIINTGGVQSSTVTGQVSISARASALISLYPTRTSGVSVSIGSGIPAGKSVAVVTYSLGDAYCLTTPSCAGLTFKRAISANHATNFQNTTIFYANSAGSTGTSISFTTVNAVWLYAIVYVYDGTLVLDQTASHNSLNSATIDTGTTAATATYNALAVASTFQEMCSTINSVSNSYAVKSSTATSYPATVGFTTKGLTTAATTTTTATYATTLYGAGCVAVFYYSAFASSVNSVILSSIYEDGSALASISVLANTLGGSAAITVGSVACAYEFDSTLSVLSWSNGALSRQYYILASGETVKIIACTGSAGTDFRTYLWQIKDYSNMVATGCYVQLGRTVSGTSYTVLRARILDSINGVPTVLMDNAVYTLKVVNTAGATVYDFGYYSPTSSLLTPTLTLKVITFSDQAQVSYRLITAEATRPAGTQIVANYNDTLHATTLIALTIRYLNGTTAYSTSSSNYVASFTWNSAISTLGYTVSMVGTNPTLGTITYVKTLPETFATYSAPINLGLFGSTGTAGLTANALPILIVVAVFACFSFATLGVGAIMGTGTAALLKAIGWWASPDWGMLTFAFCLAVLFAISEARRWNK